MTCHEAEGTTWLTALLFLNTLSITLVKGYDGITGKLENNTKNKCGRIEKKRYEVMISHCHMYTL